MDNCNKLLKQLIMPVLWFVQGIIVGIGAILPGISGGTLCVAFGMYRPLIETISNIKTGVKRYGFMLLIFISGVCAGFVGLSGIASLLLEKDTDLVTCAFIGFILGTVPDLWKDAGQKGHGKVSVFSMIASLLIMASVLYLLKTSISVQIHPGILAYLLCGVLWGLSFIVPGLSSSSLLLFFGLYQPMLNGISEFKLSVLIPIAIGGVVVVLLLSKVVGYAYKTRYSIVSHIVLGIILATAIMIMPTKFASVQSAFLSIFLIAAGFVLSYILTKICDRIKQKAVN